MFERFSPTMIDQQRLPLLAAGNAAQRISMSLYHGKFDAGI
jgi:hypothetical protein